MILQVSKRSSERTSLEDFLYRNSKFKATCLLLDINHSARKRGESFVLNDSAFDVPENDLTRDEFSNGDSHVVIPPQKLCKKVEKGQRGEIKG